MSMATETLPKGTPANDDVLVKKEIFVKTPPARAFDVFTKQMGRWWPLVTHKIGKSAAVDAVVEPFQGGRWYEKDDDGSECDWGRVLAWEPPGRLVLSWEITADWQHDVALHTEVEIRFASESGGTRVSLEHRSLSAYGARAEEMRGIFDSQGGWTGLLAAFANAASAA